MSVDFLFVVKRHLLQSNEMKHADPLIIPQTFQVMQSSISLPLKEPLLVTANAAEERCNELDQAHHRDSSSVRLFLDEDDNEGAQKSFHADKNGLGCCSCVHWYISKFLFPLLLITQQVTTFVLLVPFLFMQFGFEDEANATAYILPPRLVIGSSLTLFVMLIWLYNHEKAPATQEFLLRILHPAILVEMNIALMLILDNKEEIAIATLLVSMVGVGTFVLFSVQESNSSSNNKVKEKSGDLLIV